MTGAGRGGGPVVAVDLGDTGVAVSVDRAGVAGSAGFTGGPLDPVDVGCPDGPVDLAAVFAPPDGGALVVGHEARRRAVADPGRYEPAPRRRVDEGELLLGTRVVGVSEALGAVLAAAVDRVGPLLRGERPGLLVLTHPAGWGASRRELLRRAGSGLADAVRLLPEPVAVAAYAAWLRPAGRAGAGDGGAGDDGAGDDRAGDGGDGAGDGPVAVLDAGAAAVAAAVVAPDGTVLAARFDDGPDSGAGDDADEALLAHVVAGLRADDPALARVREVLAGHGLPERRHRQVLTDDVRAARERLSDAEQAPVPLPGRATAAWCSREELAAVLAPATARAVSLLEASMAAAGVGPDDLDGVWLVGGMARTPSLATAVHRALGRPPTVAGEPRLVAARGALAAVRADPVPLAHAPPGRGRLPAAAPPHRAGPDPQPPRARPEPRPGAGALAGPDPSRALAALVLPDWPRAPAPEDAATDALPLPASRRPRPGRRRLALVAAVAAVAVAVVGAVAAVRASSAPDVVTAFSHRFVLPPGWVPDGEDAAARRSRIRPSDAPSGPALIAVQEDTVGAEDAAAARARLAERYAAARAGGQQVTGLDLAASVGGRPVVHYEQSPEPGTVVDWSVVFSGPLQLSVGCRYDASTRAEVLDACARVVDGVAAR